MNFFEELWNTGISTNGQKWTLGDAAIIAGTTWATGGVGGVVAASALLAQKQGAATAAAQAKAQRSAMRAQKAESVKSHNQAVAQAWNKRGGLQPEGWGQPTQGVAPQSGTSITSPTSGLADVLG